MRLKADDQDNAVVTQVCVTCRAECELKAIFFPSKAFILKLGYFLTGIFYEEFEFKWFTEWA